MEDVLTGRRYTVWAGAADARGVGGVGVAVAGKWLEAVEGWETVSPRVGVLRMAAAPVPVSVVVAYAPVEAAAEVDKEAFYGELDRVVGFERQGRAVYVIGDMNARVGGQREGEEKVVGAWGVGERNGNGSRLVPWAHERVLAVANTFFRKRRCRMPTWRSPAVAVGGSA